MADGLIGRTELAKVLDCSRKTTYKMQELDDDFPRSLKDGCGSTKWRRSDVEHYINLLWERTNGGDRETAGV